MVCYDLGLFLGINVSNSSVGRNITRSVAVDADDFIVIVFRRSRCIVMVAIKLRFRCGRIIFTAIFQLVLDGECELLTVVGEDNRAVTSYWSRAIPLLRNIICGQ